MEFPVSTKPARGLSSSLEERLLCKQRVVGSSPTVSTNSSAAYHNWLVDRPHKPGCAGSNPAAAPICRSPNGEGTVSKTACCRFESCPACHLRFAGSHENRIYRGVAQLGEREVWDLEAACSIHVAPTISLRAYYPRVVECRHGSGLDHLEVPESDRRGRTVNPSCSAPSHVQIVSSTPCR